ncbi:MAG: hypothetical protein EOP88_01615 [Verrucomicrobiaceae bacterium]|nr:MAG: hypothetical protein EOP88_01615 [Verrucomicrobiaceae bacterium]
MVQTFRDPAHGSAATAHGAYFSWSEGIRATTGADGQGGEGRTAASSSLHLELPTRIEDASSLVGYKVVLKGYCQTVKGGRATVLAQVGRKVFSESFGDESEPGRDLNICFVAEEFRDSTNSGVPEPAPPALSLILLLSVQGRSPEDLVYLEIDTVDVVALHL